MGEIQLKGKNGSYRFDPDILISPPKGFGRVFKGVCNESGEGVAVKMLHPSLKDSRAALLRFVQEGLMLRYDCPQIIRMMDFCTLDGNAFVVSELLTGSDLKKYIEKHRVTGNEKVSFLTKCFIQLCHGMEFLHKQSVYHTDIKPRNLFLLHDHNHRAVRENPQLKLIDLGIAYTKDPAFEHARIPYSLIYSPPEQILGAKELTGPHTDMYAAGITFYELLTGHPPFESDNPLLLMNMQLGLPLPRNEEIPGGLMEILDKVTSKSKLERPPNYYEKEELGRLLIEGIKGRYINASDLRLALEQFLAANPAGDVPGKKNIFGFLKKK